MNESIEQRWYPPLLLQGLTAGCLALSLWGCARGDGKLNQSLDESFEEESIDRQITDSEFRDVLALTANSISMNGGHLDEEAGIELRSQLAESDSSSPLDASRDLLLENWGDFVDLPDFQSHLVRLASETGTLELFVYNGRVDAQDLYPDCVAIGNDTEWFCSGTLVAPNVVLSAAHCLSRGPTQIYIGPDVQQSGRSVEINRSKSASHPGYSPDTQFRDVAVLILREDVRHPVQRTIAPSTVIDSAGILVVAGYGHTSVSGPSRTGERRFASVIVASNSCNANQALKYKCDQDNELIVAPYGGRGTCVGDSGGPAYITDGSRVVLAGAISRSLPGGSSCGGGAILTRVDRIASWIRSVPGGHW